MVRYLDGDIWENRRDILSSGGTIFLSAHSYLHDNGSLLMRGKYLGNASQIRPQAPYILGREIYWQCGHSGNYFLIEPIPGGYVDFGLFQVRSSTKLWTNHHVIGVDLYLLSGACRKLDAWSKYNTVAHVDMPEDEHERNMMPVMSRLLGNRVVVWRGVSSPIGEE